MITFFFSSRRRHTRLTCDWSSDVCSSDLAKTRGPLVLRSRGRAVTAEDFEQLARDVAPEAARVRCLPAGDDVPGAVRIVVVPHVATDDVGRVRREDLDPDDATLDRIARYLDDR